MSLIDQLKKARQSAVVVEGKTFTITRPTPMEAMVWLVGVNGDALAADDLKLFFEQRFSLHNEAWRKLAQTAIETFVLDWPGMLEINVVPNGVNVPVAFDKALFLLWVQDYPATVTGLAYHIFQAWLNYLTAQEADEKKSLTGTSQEPLQNLPAA